MFNVTYYEQSDNVVKVKVDAIQFLHLLELCAAGRAITADFQGKSIDCNKLLRSLKFV